MNTTLIAILLVLAAGGIVALDTVKRKARKKKKMKAKAAKKRENIPNKPAFTPNLSDTIDMLEDKALDVLQRQGLSADKKDSILQTIREDGHKTYDRDHYRLFLSKIIADEADYEKKYGVNTA